MKNRAWGSISLSKKVDSQPTSTAGEVGTLACDSIGNPFEACPNW